MWLARLPRAYFEIGRWTLLLPYNPHSPYLSILSLFVDRRFSFASLPSPSRIRKVYRIEVSVDLGISPDVTTDGRPFAFFSHVFFCIGMSGDSSVAGGCCERMYFSPPNAFFPLDGWKEGCLASAVRARTLFLVARGRGFLIMLSFFLWLPVHIYILSTVRWECDQSRTIFWVSCLRAKVFWIFLFCLFFFASGDGARRAVPTPCYFAPGYQPFDGAVGPRVGSLRSDRGSVESTFRTDCVDDD